MHLRLLIFRLFKTVATAIIISGCATAPFNPRYYTVDRSADYPVTIVAATFVPPIEIDIALSGKADGAKKGATAGVLHCSPSLAAGPFAPFVFVPCAVLAGVVGGTVGAWNAAPKAEIDSIQPASQSSHGTATQELLAEKARAYLAELSENPVTRAGPELIGPASVEDRPKYQPAAAARGSLLELSMLDIRYVGSGQEGDPVCLRMTALGRKIDSATGAVVDEMNYTLDVECQTPENWTKDGGKRFETALHNGYLAVARFIIDRLYLVYHTVQREPRKDVPSRPVPRYVLAPVTPPAPEMYLDFRAITRQAKHVQGWGGMHFEDVDTLTPTLSWEAFPRPFDLPAGGFTDVSYDLRIYTSRLILDGKFAEPADLLQEWADLDEPRYSLTTPLQPCSRYFWTVRARFTLNGTRRVTEWSGAYYTPGGEVGPSQMFYFPFRTPGSGDKGNCWK